MEDEGEQEVGREQRLVRIGGERKEQDEREGFTVSEAVYGGGRLSDMAAALTAAKVMSILYGLGNFNPKSQTHSHLNVFKRL